MTIVQTYILTAADELEAPLEDALRRLAATVGELEGCESVGVLRDVKNPRRYVFIETYGDADAHRASAAHVPKQLLTDIMALLAGEPEVLTLAPCLAR